jgi:hypothetical protein
MGRGWWIVGWRWKQPLSSTGRERERERTVAVEKGRGSGNRGVKTIVNNFIKEDQRKMAVILREPAENI